MAQDQVQRILNLFSQREYELKIEQRAYEIKLGVLEPFGAICIGSGIVLPLLAGFTLLGKPAFFGNSWELISGSLSLLAAILTGIHAGFNCDKHHGECRRLIKALQSLIEGYQAAKTLNESQLETRFNELETRLKDLRDGSEVRTDRWCTRQAKREVGVVHQAV
jgi:hypothetical protein